MVSPRTHTTPLPPKIFLCPLANVKIMPHGPWKALRPNLNTSCDASPPLLRTPAVFDLAVPFPGLSWNTVPLLGVASVFIVISQSSFVFTPHLPLHFTDHTALTFAYFSFAVLWSPPNKDSLCTHNARTSWWAVYMSGTKTKKQKIRGRKENSSHLKCFTGGVCLSPFLPPP